MKFRVPDIVLGAFLTVAVLAMGMLFESSRRHPTQQPTASDAAKENTSHQPERSLWNWLTHDAAGFFTLWLVIVGGGQIGLFYWQLRLIRVAAEDAKRAGLAAERAAKATEDAVKLAGETAKRQLRAYVNVGSSQLDNFGFDQPPTITVELVNNGQTPAYRLRRSMTLFASEFPFTKEVILTEGKRESILGPSGKINMGPNAMGAALTAEQTQSVISGDWAIYALGVVKYFDAFNEERTTRFSLYFRGNGKSPGQNGIALSHAEKGNEAD